MHSAILLSILLAPVVLTNGEAGNPQYGFPRMMGGSKFKAALQNRETFGNAQVRDFNAEAIEGQPPSISETQTIGPRQNCGPGVGSCGAGLCCSSDGVCGTGINFCEGPDCQYNYGPACDANTVPPGASTSGIARPQLGSIPYGTRINDCTRPGVIALTFDDGPYLYTKDLLDLLDRYNAKVTFFITGNNLGKGRIDDCSTGYPALIQRMVASGHQVASHSWTHQDFVGLSQTDFNHQVYYNEMAFRNILGYFPTYLRPPYVDCDSQCFSRLATVGYHAIYYDLDTFDYLNDDPTLIQNSKNNFANYITSSAPNPATGNMLPLSHDIHYQTVHNLTEFMLQTMAAHGYGTSVTVGTCLGDPPANWYRSAGSPTGCTSGPGTTTSSAAPSTTSAVVISTDGTCGIGKTCLGSTYGNCCSRYGFCGSTADYCGPFCQPAFGTCSPTPTSTSTALRVSTDGSCGSGITCQGSTFGNCCSQYGFCGSTTAYCGTGCNPGFGTCS